MRGETIGLHLSMHRTGPCAIRSRETGASRSQIDRKSIASTSMSGRWHSVDQCENGTHRMSRACDAPCELLDGSPWQHNVFCNLTAFEASTRILARKSGARIRISGQLLTAVTSDRSPSEIGEECSSNPMGLDNDWGFPARAGEVSGSGSWGCDDGGILPRGLHREPETGKQTAPAAGWRRFMQCTATKGRHTKCRFRE